MPGLDGNFRVFTDRSEDALGINTASVFVLKDNDKKGTSDLVYGNTSGQPGIQKAMIEQIIPAISNASIGTFTGVFFPKPGGTNINAGNVGNVSQGQGQGQFQGQKQGQRQTTTVKNTNKNTATGIGQGGQGGTSQAVGSGSINGTTFNSY